MGNGDTVYAYGQLPTLPLVDLKIETNPQSCRVCLDLLFLLHRSVACPQKLEMPGARQRDQGTNARGHEGYRLESVVQRSEPRLDDWRPQSRVSIDVPLGGAFSSQIVSPSVGSFRVKLLKNIVCC